MLVCKVHSPLLRGGTDFITTLHKALILRTSSIAAIERTVQTYGLLPFGPSRFTQRIMILRDMQPQKMLRREVLTAFRTSVRVDFRVVDLEFFEGGEIKRVVRRK